LLDNAILNANKIMKKKGLQGQTNFQTRGNNNLNRLDCTLSFK